VTDPVDLAQAVVGSLGVRSAAHLDARRRVRRDAFDRLVDALADKDAILLIDNCEHLIEAAADLVDRLLARCGRLRVVATSREPLAITGEVLFAVPPLRHDDVSDPAAALASPAVRLFADRARAVNASLRLDEDSVAAVVEICRRLDGLPLAIELAAARTRTMSVEQIAARLDDRFRLLTGGSRTALPRHRTLRAVVDWSWELLTDAERELAERIAVFPAGVTPESASAALDGEDAEDLLGALVDRSLLQFVGGTRYRMLETLREYGADRLAEEDELAAARARHGEYFRSVAVAAEEGLRSADQLRWIAMVDDERDNFFAAITYFAEQGNGAAALQVAGSLGWFLTMRGEHDTAMTWMSIALDVPGTEGTELRAQTLGAYALNRMILVDANEGMRLLAEADADLRPYVHPEAAPLTTVVGAVTSLFSGNEVDARRRLDYGRQSGNPWTIAALALVQAQVAENAGDLTGMREAARVGMEHARLLEERFVIANLLELESKIRVLDGDLLGAIERLETAAELDEEFGNYDDAARARCTIGMCYLRLGEPERAREAIKEVRDRFEQLGSTIGLVMVDSASAQLARNDGDLTAALDYAEAAVRRVRAELSAAPPQILAITIAEWAHAKLAGTPTEADLDEVAEELAEAAHGPMQIVDMPVLAEVAVAQAQLLARRGDVAGSAVRLGVAEKLRGTDDPTSLDIAALRKELTERLGGDGFAEAFESGRTLPRDAALDVVAPYGEGAPLGWLGSS
jgi:predicted ATPase